MHLLTRHLTLRASYNHLIRPCFQNVDLPSGKAVEVTCEAEGKYVTLATPKDLVLCDIYITGEVRATNRECADLQVGQ